MLSEQIGTSVDTAALINLLDGVPFPRVLPTRYCCGTSRPCRGPAARAVAVSVHDVDWAAPLRGWSVPWLDDVNDEPFWAVRPLVELLSAHDTTVASDLLGVGPQGSNAKDASVTLQHTVHALADALLDMDVAPATVVHDLGANLVRSANFADMALLAETLLSTGTDAADDDEVDCAGCEAAQSSLPIRAWTLTLLAECPVAARVGGLVGSQACGLVGEPDGVVHPVQFMASLLDTVARSAAAASQFD